MSPFDTGPVFVRDSAPGFVDGSDAIAAVLHVAASAASSALDAWRDAPDHGSEGFALGCLASYLDTACDAHPEAARAFWTAYHGGRVLRAELDDAIRRQLEPTPRDPAMTETRAFDAWRATCARELPPACLPMASRGFAQGWGPLHTEPTYPDPDCECCGGEGDDDDNPCPRCGATEDCNV